jgi:DNA mismatch repair protein MutS
VPKEYRPVQTLKDRQRYTLPEMKEKEREVYRLEALIRRREEEVFLEVRERAKRQAEALREAARILAELDVYAALAEAAVRYGYVRPRFGDRLQIRAGRHPVVERRTEFVPNDLEMAHELVLVTGPNMAGKSTYLRQTALIALLAQVGSFVPPMEATLPLLDGIYPRIGASDDLAGGKSTFMVEMEEVALILKEATENSLVLLDEVGRGTSSLDGVAIATAVAEALHERRAYTLFATHYFELTALGLPRLKNLHVAAREEAGGSSSTTRSSPAPPPRATAWRWRPWRACPRRWWPGPGPSSRPWPPGGKGFGRGFGAASRPGPQPPDPPRGPPPPPGAKGLGPGGPLGYHEG